MTQKLYAFKKHLPYNDYHRKELTLAYEIPIRAILLGVFTYLSLLILAIIF